MTKMIALAAALIAGTTMTSVANADGVRLGFGFPLGSFVAHQNQNYDGGDYRRSERPRYVRRDRDDDAPARKVVRVQRPSQADVAEVAKAPAIPAVRTAKLDDKLASDPSTTTVIEKTPAAKSDASPVNAVATTGSTDTKTAVNSDKIATAEKPARAESDANATTANTDTTHVCRRYSPTIAALVDVPCE
jgi:hypothetical protein